MSNELVPVDLSQLPSTQLGSDDAFADLAKGGDFLARLQLYSKGSAVDQQLIAPGHWGIPESAEDITDLGESIDVLPLARRPKALDMNDRDAVIAAYDMESDEFKRIMAAAQGKDSGCMYGPSFLVIERSTGRFLEYFCGTKSTRSEAKKIYPFLPLTPGDIEARGLDGVDPHGPLPVTLRVKYIKKKFSWHAPVVIKCSTPFQQLPMPAVIVKQVQDFINPKEPTVEKVDEKDAGKRRAR